MSVALGVRSVQFKFYAKHFDGNEEFLEFVFSNKTDNE